MKPIEQVPPILFSPRLSIEEKIEIAHQTPRFKAWWNQNPAHVQDAFYQLRPEGRWIVSLLILLEETHLLTKKSAPIERQQAVWQQRTDELWPTELFYQKTGGLLGYYQKAIHALLPPEDIEPLPPPTIDLGSAQLSKHKYIWAGLQSLPDLIEIYPIGGLAERLCVKKPAAFFRFSGKTLLEWLIENLQAREALFYKIFGHKVVVPIILMTSSAHGSDRTIRNFLEKHDWLGKTEDDFFICQQPCVPALTKEPKIALNQAGEIILEPNGHGALWAALKQQGALSWIKQKGKKYGLIRQINNPIIGQDDSLLLFCGIGAYKKKSLGIASCPALFEGAEGRLAVDSQQLYCMEYCHLPKKALEKWHKCPANSNVIFINVELLEKVSEEHLASGGLCNFKENSKNSARLEHSLQDIFSLVPMTKEPCGLYITTNKRRKTLAAIKKREQSSGKEIETVERCYWALLKNHQELLRYAGVHFPSVPSYENLLKNQCPPFHLNYHPALGPLFSVIARKWMRGTIMPSSDIKLEISELLFKKVHIQGGLKIIAKKILEGRCILENVKIKNEGSKSHNGLIDYCSGSLDIEETCEIILHGHSCFIAKNLNIDGCCRFEIPDGYCGRLRKRYGCLYVELSALCH